MNFTAILAAFDLTSVGTGVQSLLIAGVAIVIGVKGYRLLKRGLGAV